MPTINGQQAQAIAAALSRAGGKWTPLYRTPTDANGVPAGEAVRIGCLLGKTYTKGQASFIRIDIPGVIAPRDVTRFEGVQAGGETPKEGDALCAGGKRIKIMAVNTEAAPLIVLTLDSVH